ncbi:AraC family ethanolamine operon transcriptional activator [Bradyrhizobium sp. USDA 4369]
MQLARHCGEAPCDRRGLLVPPETQSLQTFGPRLVVRQSDDVLDHVKGLGGWKIRLQQLSAGRLRAEVIGLHLDNIQFVRERTTQALLKDVETGDDQIVFSQPLQASGPGYVNGHMIGYPDPCLLGGGALPSIRTPQYLDVATLVVDKAHLLRWLTELGESELADMMISKRQLTCLQVEPTSLPVVKDVSLQLCGSSGITERVLGFEQSRRAIEDDLLHALMQSMRVTRRRTLTSVTLQRRLADRAWELVLASPDEPPTISDLCRQLGVSRRSLQDGFQGAFGLAPTQFLRVVRLNAVRRDLMASAGNSVPPSIGDIAARWGFWHWSRFTSYYRGLFGELPSETFRRFGARARAD